MQISRIVNVDMEGIWSVESAKPSKFYRIEISGLLTSMKKSVSPSKNFAALSGDITPDSILQSLVQCERHLSIALIIAKHAIRYRGERNVIHHKNRENRCYCFVKPRSTTTEIQSYDIVNVPSTSVLGQRLPCRDSTRFHFRCVIRLTAYRWPDITVQRSSRPAWANSNGVYQFDDVIGFYQLIGRTCVARSSALQHRWHKATTWWCPVLHLRRRAQ